MNLAITAGQIAAILGGRVEGDPATVLNDLAGLGDARPGHLAFFANPRYEPQLATTQASAVLIAAPHAVLAKRGVCQIIVAQPDAALAGLMQQFAPPLPRPPAGVHPTAVIADDVVLGEGARIGPWVVIGAGARIGARTVLHAHVAIGDRVQVGADCLLWQNAVVREHCVLGDRVILQPGAVIGSDGFGYVPVGGKHAKIPQVGNVVIGDDVEVGANSTIDRARFGTTRIGAGTKIDNLVMVAHNVQVGADCLLVAQCGVAGSTRLGDRVVIGGQAGLAGHLRIGDGAMVGAQAGVGKHLDPGAQIRALPGLPPQQAVAQEVAVRRLARGQDEMKRMQERIAALEAALARLGGGAP